MVRQETLYLGWGEKRKIGTGMSCQAVNRDKLIEGLLKILRDVYMYLAGFK
jgi:hypothetical protein